MRNDPLNAVECSRYLKALADPDRLRIIRCLQQGPLTVGEISRSLDSAVANVSHHLKQLRLAKLVCGRRRGRFVVYSLSAQFAGRSGRMSSGILDFGCCRVELGRKRAVQHSIVR